MPKRRDQLICPKIKSPYHPPNLPFPKPHLAYTAKGFPSPEPEALPIS